MRDYAHSRDCLKERMRTGGARERERKQISPRETECVRAREKERERKKQRESQWSSARARSQERERERQIEMDKLQKKDKEKRRRDRLDKRRIKSGQTFRSCCAFLDSPAPISEMEKPLRGEENARRGLPHLSRERTLPTAAVTEDDDDDDDEDDDARSTAGRGRS